MRSFANKQLITEGEWYTLHCIGEVSNLLPEYKTNTITRSAACCNNRDDLLNLNLILKIAIFSEVYLEPSRHIWRNFFAKIANGFQPLHILAKKFDWILNTPLLLL